MNNKRCPVVLIFVTVVFQFSFTAAQMIADITADIETEFGTYYPYPVEFTPAVPSFTVEPDFSNVENWSVTYGFSAVDSMLLQQNHLVLCRFIQDLGWAGIVFQLIHYIYPGN